jgi:hypothetical protein
MGKEEECAYRLNFLSRQGLDRQAHDWGKSASCISGTAAGFTERSE